MKKNVWAVKIYQNWPTNQSKKETQKMWITQKSLKKIETVIKNISRNEVSGQALLVSSTKYLREKKSNSVFHTASSQRTEED